MSFPGFEEPTDEQIVASYENPGIPLKDWPHGVTVVCDGQKSDMPVSQLSEPSSLGRYRLMGISKDEKQHITIRVSVIG